MKHTKGRPGGWAGRHLSTLPSSPRPLTPPPPISSIPFHFPPPPVQPPPPSSTPLHPPPLFELPVDQPMRGVNPLQPHPINLYEMSKSAGRKETQNECSALVDQEARRGRRRVRRPPPLAPPPRSPSSSPELSSNQPWFILSPLMPATSIPEPTIVHSSHRRPPTICLTPPLYHFGPILLGGAHFLLVM